MKYSETVKVMFCGDSGRFPCRYDDKTSPLIYLLAFISFTGLGLVEAKTAVEKGGVLKENVAKEDAEKILPLQLRELPRLRRILLRAPLQVRWFQVRSSL